MALPAPAAPLPSTTAPAVTVRTIVAPTVRTALACFLYWKHRPDDDALIARVFSEKHKNNIKAHVRHAQTECETRLNPGKTCSKPWCKSIHVELAHWEACTKMMCDYCLETDMNRARLKCPAAEDLQQEEFARTMQEHVDAHVAVNNAKTALKQPKKMGDETTTPALQHTLETANARLKAAQAVMACTIARILGDDVRPAIRRQRCLLRVEGQVVSTLATASQSVVSKVETMLLHLNAMKADLAETLLQKAHETRDLETILMAANMDIEKWTALTEMMRAPLNIVALADATPSAAAPATAASSSSSSSSSAAAAAAPLSVFSEPYKLRGYRNPDASKRAKLAGDAATPGRASPPKVFIDLKPSTYKASVEIDKSPEHAYLTHLVSLFVEHKKLIFDTATPEALSRATLHQFYCDTPDKIAKMKAICAARRARQPLPVFALPPAGSPTLPGCSLCTCLMAGFPCAEDEEGRWVHEVCIQWWMHRVYGMTTAFYDKTEESRLI